MSDPAAPIDPRKFLEAAARLKMVPPEAVKELIRQAKRSGSSPGAYLIDAGRLTAIQAEAVEGVCRPESVAEGYEVEGLLGHGGIGVVYRARQPKLDRVVALKTITTSRFTDGEGGKTSSAVARFRQEARVIAKLKHPNIVTAYDYGATDERLYLAMEMVDGIDLETHIGREQRLDERSAWRIAAQVAAALAEAAESGVIHRDIKPANLLLTDPPAGYPLPAGTPLVKVTDFGLARFQAGGSVDSTRLTMTGATMGTPHYMAPEQIDDAQVGLHADIYALGATIFHMLTGEPPYAGLSLMKIFAAKLSGEAAGLDELPGDVGEPSSRLLRDMLRPKPADRPQDYAELLTRIGDVLDDDSLGATIASGAPGPPLSLRGQHDSSMLSQTLLAIPTRGRPLVKGVAAAACLAALAVAGLFWTQRLGAPPEPRYKVASGPRAGEVFLYRGDGTDEWSNARAPIVEGYEGFLEILNTSSRNVASATRSFDDPEHYGLSFEFRLAETTEALEVRFDRPRPEEPGKTLRIEGATAVVGYRTGESDADFRPESEPFKIVPSQTSPYPTLRIDRDQSHWFVYQQVSGEPRPRRIGATRHGAAPPEKIWFKAIGGPAYIGTPMLFELAPVDAE